MMAEKYTFTHKTSDSEGVRINLGFCRVDVEGEEEDTISNANFLLKIEENAKEIKGGRE